MHPFFIKKKRWISHFWKKKLLIINSIKKNKKFMRKTSLFHFLFTYQTKSLLNSKKVTKANSKYKRKFINYLEEKHYVYVLPKFENIFFNISLQILYKKLFLTFFKNSILIIFHVWIMERITLSSVFKRSLCILIGQLNWA